MSVRSSKSGDAFDNDMKLQKRYDKEEELGTPQRIIEWITQVLGTKDNLPSNGTYDWRTVHSFLKDGVILCKLMNRLLKLVGMPTIVYRTKVQSSFVALSNIESFVAAAKAFGVPETSLFQPSDLVDGRKGQLLFVLNCLNQLGMLANARGFSPRYQGIQPPKPDWANDLDDQ
jgi:hypothetical protein